MLKSHAATSESILWDCVKSSSAAHVSCYQLLSSALRLFRCYSEENRESLFNTVAHSFIHYKLSLCDSPGPVLYAEVDTRMIGGL